jgi:hypothetical protein
VTPTRALSSSTLYRDATGLDGILERIRMAVALRNGRYVKKVERMPYSGLVYNLEVEEDQTYAGRTWVAHNCNVIQADGKGTTV